MANIENQKTVTFPVRVATELLPQLSKSKLQLVLQILSETYEVGFQRGLEEGRKGPRNPGVQS